MRLELAGSLIRPDPLVLIFTADDSITIPNYIELGYTHFDVICIGAGGGRGGGIDTNNTGTKVRNYGGSGGGGGFHRTSGLLSALPDTCSVVVGSQGVNGTDHNSDPGSTSDGGDGGASTFNTNTCRASGGKGGKRAQSNSTTVATQAHGGDGGVGNRTIAGGGGTGGTAGTPTDTGPGTPGTPGQDGTFYQNIGKGGGGGAGGVGTYLGVMCNAATAGGKGEYNPADTSVYGVGESPSNDIPSGAPTIVPGRASGGKAAPLNGLPTLYGRSGMAGVVVIRLTSVGQPKPVTPPPSELDNTYGKAIYGESTYSS
jgi:hypothetical protein